MLKDYSEMIKKMVSIMRIIISKTRKIYKKHNFFIIVIGGSFLITFFIILISEYERKQWLEKDIEIRCKVADRMLLEVREDLSSTSSITREKMEKLIEKKGIHDPFGGKIKYKAGDKFIIYSNGPDGIDQKGIVQYEPTNGVMSSGDIIMQLP